MSGSAKRAGLVTLKRLLPPTVLIILISLAFILPAQANPLPTIEIAPSNVTVPAGGETTLGIRLKNAQDHLVVAWELHLKVTNGHLIEFLPKPVQEQGTGLALNGLTRLKVVDTTLTFATTGGATEIFVASVQGLAVNLLVDIDTGVDRETNKRITAINVISATTTRLTLGSPLSRPHPASVPVQVHNSDVAQYFSAQNRVSFAATLTPGQETPPITTVQATGSGSFTLQTTGSEAALPFEVTVNTAQLTGPITAAHFHHAAPGVAGGVVRAICGTQSACATAFAGGTARGVWSSTDSAPLTPALVDELWRGNLYVNIHTAAHPGGEIRGQIVDPIDYTITLLRFDPNVPPTMSTPFSGNADLGLGNIRIRVKPGSPQGSTAEIKASVLKVVKLTAPGGTLEFLPVGPAAGTTLTTITVDGLCTQQLNLKKGWNLVSIFCAQPTAPAPGAIFNNVGTFSIFAWDSAAQGYVIPTQVVPGQGYWVAVFADATQTVTGAGVTTYTRNVPQGWSLIGSVATASATATGLVELTSGGPLGLTLFEWDPVTQGYVSTPLNAVRPGFGYWLSAFGPAGIRVRPQ